MRVSFSQDKKHLLVVHETPFEYKALSTFPAFIKLSIYNALPCVLPVCYSVINRLKKRFKDKVKVDKSVAEWLESPFTLAKLPETFYYHTKPKDFQEIALRYIYTLGSAGLLLDPGMGKSKVVLDYIFLGQFSKSLIICPSALLFVWEDEINKHRPELSFHVVKSTDWEKEAAGISAAQVTIMNYNKAVIMKHRLKEVGYQFMHLDEFLIKDPKTDRTKALTEISRNIPYRAGGSGTLINNSPMDAYCPSRYLQPALVGWSYKNFQDVYAITQPLKDENGNPTNRNRVVAFRGTSEVKSILESCSIVMTKEEWLKLPPKVFKDINVGMSDEQRDAYFQLMRNYRLEFQGEEVEVDNPLVMMSKLYQIAGGFLYINPEIETEILQEFLPGEDEVKKVAKKTSKASRKVLYFKNNAKIAALERLLTQTIPGRKSIIWFNLEAEYVMLKELLDRLGLKHVVVKGGEKDVGGKIRSFNQTPEILYALCQSKSVNYGITVLGSKPEKKQEQMELEGFEIIPDIETQVYTQVFFSFNFSLEVYLQQQDRTHRLGQDRECEYYRLFTNSPIDRKIRQALEDKLDLKRTMLVDVAQTLLKESAENVLSDSTNAL